MRKKCITSILLDTEQFIHYFNNGLNEKVVSKLNCFLLIQSKKVASYSIDYDIQTNLSENWPQRQEIPKNKILASLDLEIFLGKNYIFNLFKKFFWKIFVKNLNKINLSKMSPRNVAQLASWGTWRSCKKQVSGSNPGK